MKISELLREEDLDISEDVIIQKCAPFLSKVGGFEKYITQPLYRGMKRQYGITHLLNRTENRQPRDTPAPIHALINDWFKKNTGYYWRSNAVFATGDYDMADKYGYVNVFFPVGDFNFCWSKNYTDLFTALQNYTTVLNDYSSGDRSSQEMARIENQINILLDRGEYTVNQNLQGAIDSGKEIMFSCSQYIVIPYQEFIK